MLPLGEAKDGSVELAGKSLGKPLHRDEKLGSSQDGRRSRYGFYGCHRRAFTGGTARVAKIVCHEFRVAIESFFEL